MNMPMIFTVYGQAQMSISFTGSYMYIGANTDRQAQTENHPVAVLGGMKISIRYIYPSILLVDPYTEHVGL